MKIVAIGMALMVVGCAPTTAGEPTAQRRAVIDLTSKPGEPALEEIYPDTAGMPEDVQRYIVQHQGCVHWGGEPDFNAARRRQIQKAIEELCTGIDAIGREVRARHANNPAVLARIKDYENLEE